MKRWAGRILLCLVFFNASSCKGGDPRIGLVLKYQAKQPTDVVLLHFDEFLMMDGRAGPLHLRPTGWKQEALTTPARIDWPPREISATWRYTTAADPDPASHTVDPNSIPWRQARATVPLRSKMTPEDLKLMRDGRHRFKLRLLFDADRLDVRWELEPIKKK